jgi:hypothetical protein
VIEGINIPRAIYLYDGGIKDLNFKRMRSFIKDNFGDISIRLIELKKEAVKTRGLLFDFINTKKAFDSLKYARAEDACHILLTNKLFATLNEDKRPHIRAAIFGYPSIISASGIVEGPAKPREYYLYKQKYTRLGVWEIEEPRLKEKFKGRFIDYQDKRMSEVLKGYVSQALFFYITGEPFCPDKSCRLYNAHWQEDLIYSQIKSGEFCAVHKKILLDIG